MARNGAGTYSRAVASYVATTTIDQDAVNQEMDDIATALTGSIAKNGETVPTANLPMGTYRHTGVGNGSARTDYAAMGQVQDGKVNWVDGGGTADAITATYSPAITALGEGQLCHVRATAANATTTPTFSPNSLTARTIVKTGGVALVAGDIAGDGHELILRYDLTNTRWELLNPGPAAYQPLDALLTALAGQTTAAAKIQGYSGSDAVTLYDFKDEDNMASNSATAMPSQQSVVAYVAAQIAAIPDALTLGTAVATTSGTAVEFTSIPAGTKRFTLMSKGVSISGTSYILIQLGTAGGYETTGYAGQTAYINSGTSGQHIPTDGIRLYGTGSSAATLNTGALTFTNIDGNTWVCEGNVFGEATSLTNMVAMGKTLSDTLTKIKITTGNGTDTFDAGSINILYE